jgi:predicted HD phosphohydrolase
LFIADHWKDSNIDKDTLIKCALVHDLGNLVKFNFEINPEFWGSEKSNTDYWRTKQKEMVAKYGATDNEATSKILKEMRFPKDLIELIYSKRFANSVHTLESDNLILKILHYSDLRTLPLKIGTLEDRFDDIRGRMPQYNKRADLADLFNACRGIEKQIQLHVDVSLSQINSDSIEYTDEDFLNIEV